MYEVDANYVVFFLGVIASYIAYAEVRRSAIHGRVMLLESDICTAEDVRTIIKSENENMLIQLAKLIEVVDRLNEGQHAMRLDMAERRSGDMRKDNEG